MLSYGFGYGAGLMIMSGVLPFAAPVNVTPPVVSPSSVAQGQTLSCTTGVWTNYPAPTFAYQWQRNLSNVPGETGSTYLTTVTDVGQSIRCVVTATNSKGSTSANSNAASVT